MFEAPLFCGGICPALSPQSASRTTVALCVFVSGWPLHPPLLLLLVFPQHLILSVLPPHPLELEQQFDGATERQQHSLDDNFGSY